MANIPSLVDQVKNEEDMINLSQDDLLTYYTNTSSLAAESKSSIEGLDTEILSFEAEITRADSTITGLDLEIIANSGTLSYLQTEELRLETESTIITEQIISTLTEIQYLDSTIDGCNSSLSSLSDEYILLDASIISSMEGFKIEADRYSSLFDVYVSKESEYVQLLNDIRDTSSLYETAKITADYSYDRWFESYSTLSGEQSTLSDLEQQEIQLDGERLLAEIELNEANRVYISTSESVDHISSLFEVALLTRDYIRYLSSEAEAINSLAQAEELFSQAQAQYAANPTTGNLSVLSNAEAVRNSMLAKRQAFLIQSGGAIPDYSTLLSTVGTIAYETLIKGYNEQIAFEQSTIEHYTMLSNYELNVNEPLFRFQRDSSLSNEAMYLNESTFWGEAYVSSLSGYEWLLNEETRLVNLINENSNRVIQLDEEIEGSAVVRRRLREEVVSEKRRYIGVAESSGASGASGASGPMLGGAIDENVDIEDIDDIFRLNISWDFIEKGLQQEVDELTSSFVNYSTISSVNTLLVRQSDEIINKYTNQYLSIGDALVLLESQRDSITSSIEGYQLESTITINQMNYLTINMNKENIEMFISFNDIERAAFQYRESYVRKIRVDRQNDYEDLIRAAVNEASNRAIAENNSNFTDLINLETPEIKSAYTTFSNLSELLKTFDTLDTDYTNRGERLSNLSAEYSIYVTLRGELLTIQQKQAELQYDTELATQFTDKNAQIAAKEQTITTLSNDVNALTTTVNIRKQNVLQTFERYFETMTLAEINNNISTFIRAGISEGMAAATLA